MMKDFLRKNFRTGFTLIELLLYVTVSALLLFGASIAFQVIFDSRIKGQVIQEVEVQGAGALIQITQALRNASSTTGPAFGTTSSTLTLSFLATSSNPTVFDLATGTIRMRQGASSTMALTNSKVIASGLLFSNLSQTTTTPGIVRVQFNLSYVNSSTRSQYNYQQIFIGSGALR